MNIGIVFILLGYAFVLWGVQTLFALIADYYEYEIEKELYKQFREEDEKNGLA